MKPQGIVAGNCGRFDAEKARPNRREPLQLATNCVPVLDAHCGHGGNQLKQRLGDQALGSRLKLLQMIDERRRRACWRDDEGPAIAGFPAEPFVPVVGHRSLEPARRRRSSGFRNRHQRGQGTGRQRPVDGLRRADWSSRNLMLRPALSHGPRLYLGGRSAGQGMDSALAFQRMTAGSPCGRLLQARYVP